MAPTTRRSGSWSTTCGAMPSRKTSTGAAPPDGVDHDPPVPVLDGDGDEAVLRAVEGGRFVEARRRHQRAVERVAPAVVRTMDRAVLARRRARCQLVGPVLADVEEAAQGAVLTAHEQDGVVADAHGAPVTRWRRARPSGRRTPRRRRTGGCAPTPARRRRGRRPRATCTPSRPGRARARGRPDRPASSMLTSPWTMLPPGPVSGFRPTQPARTVRIRNGPGGR